MCTKLPVVQAGFPLSIVVLGLNHRSAPIGLLEQCTVAPADLPKQLAELSSRSHVSEAVLVSTCNRTEAYVVAEKFHAAYAEIRDFFATSAFVAPEDLTDHMYVHHDDDAVRHLFSVASGLDSVVLGESEILGQTKSSWETARLEGTAGPVLNLLFRHALEAGKRARTETSISRHTASVSHAAVEMATRHLGSLSERAVLVVGAGEMAEGMVVALAGAGPSEVLIANRTHERATSLAGRVGGRPLPLDELDTALGEVDVLLTSTGATSVIVDHASVADVLERRAGRPLLIVDIAMPRDVDPAVARFDGVTLLDMDDLSDFAAGGRAERALEVERVGEIVRDEAQRFGDVRSAREMAPLIASLRGSVDAVRAAELERALASSTPLDDSQQAAVEKFSKALIAKLLHNPTIALKDAAGTAKGDRLADSVRDLFDL
ncbi:MAG: glutamyl-tRNA reductase [Actinomycetota bacterium]|nr:glutamyl-tRNA reductase [Actinomycetota bacterium]